MPRSNEPNLASIHVKRHSWAFVNPILVKILKIPFSCGNLLSLSLRPSDLRVPLFAEGPIPNRVLHPVSRPKISCYPVIPRVIFAIPPPKHTFNSQTRPDFASIIPNPELQIREIPGPEKPNLGPSLHRFWLLWVQLGKLHADGNVTLTIFDARFPKMSR